MPPHHDAWLRHQQSRWLRPDAARWIRPDAARFLPPGADVAKAFPRLARKYNPNQPRVPVGNPDGGQWTDGGAGGGSLGLFQITPRDNMIDGVQLAVIGRRMTDPAFRVTSRRKFRQSNLAQAPNERAISVRPLVGWFGTEGSQAKFTRAQ